MRKTCCWLVAWCLGLLGSAHAAGEANVRELHIEPSTTRVAAIGKARLSVEALTRQGENFQGPYRVEVTMLPVGDEAGQLTINVSEGNLHKLATGTAIQFSGEAVSKEGNHSNVHGTATPSSGDGGAIRVKVDGKKGKLVFNTTYRLVR